MANPPFNVDLVDAEKAKTDRRLPFGLPGTTKGAGKNRKGDAGKSKETVSNGNYLWISFFHSYLNPKGRAGFVMSSQASSAGHGEAEVRRKIVETGDVDVMIAIRSNFFYTRTVPCELWFFDKGKPEARRDTVLMLDARNIYRKVTRKIYDFSPEQLANLTAIVWLYRDQQARFLALVRDYVAAICREAVAIPGELERFETTIKGLQIQFAEFDERVKRLAALTPEQKLPLADGLAEFTEARQAYDADRAALLGELADFRNRHAAALPDTNEAQHAARHAFELLADKIKGLLPPARSNRRVSSKSAKLSCRWMR